MSMWEITDCKCGHVYIVDHQHKPTDLELLIMILSQPEQYTHLDELSDRFEIKLIG